MKVIHITAEFSPLAKAGGLGEAVYGMCSELTRLGASIEVILPKYSFIPTKFLADFCCDPIPLLVPFQGKHLRAATCTGKFQDCLVHLIDLPTQEKYFDREKIYGYPDDLFRFLAFSRSALEYLKRREMTIDVLHLHDWHTAAAAALAKEVLHLPVKKIILTMHSAEYQGPCTTQDLETVGLFGKKGPLLELGIREADQVTTVSPTYAKEIMTPEMGFGLDPFFRSISKKLTGILNGIDTHLWDPKHDTYLPKSYGVGETPKEISDAKFAAKKALHVKFNLSLKNLPWVGCITRLAEQKGLDLIEEGLHQTVKLGGTFVLLGSAATSEIEKRFQGLKEKYQNNPQVHLHLTFDEEMAHQLYAALDFFLIPSLYEPCGLAQMMAMRYGTIPVARATGGLKDTIVDCENSLVEAPKRNGFLFTPPTKEALKEALRRAFHSYKTENFLIQSLIQRAMATDFSWKKPARAYLKLYTQMS